MGEDESSNKKTKVIDQSNSSEPVHSQRQTDSVVQKRKDRATETEKSNVSAIIWLGLVYASALSHFKYQSEFK